MEYGKNVKTEYERIKKHLNDNPIDAVPVTLLNDLI